MLLSGRSNLTFRNKWPAVVCLALAVTACQTVSRTEPVQVSSVRNDFEQFDGLAKIARNVRRSATFHIKRGTADGKLELCGFAVLYAAAGTIPPQELLSYGAALSQQFIFIAGKEVTHTGFIRTFLTDEQPVANCITTDIAFDPAYLREPMNIGLGNLLKGLQTR